MSAVKKYKVRSKIAAVAFQGVNGVFVQEALEQAGINIGELREEGLNSMDATLAEMFARFGPAAKPRETDLFDLYTLSGQIIDVGLHLPNSGVAEAAYSLCELIDYISDRPLMWDGIDVHLASMQMLRLQGEALGDAQRAKVLEGLRKVVAKVSGLKPEGHSLYE